MDGNIVLDNGHSVNAAGFTIHSAVHMARHDLAVAAHTHTPAGMAVSALKDGLIPLTQNSMRFYRKTAYHGFEGPALDLDERERMGHAVDPVAIWSHCQPISREAFDDLVERHRTEDVMAATHAAVDLSTTIIRPGG